MEYEYCHTTWPLIYVEYNYKFELLLNRDYQHQDLQTTRLKCHKKSERMTWKSIIIISYSV